VMRAECLKWMVWATASLLEPIQRFARESSAGRGTPRADEAKADIDAMLRLLDAALASRAYLMGDTYTLADLAVCGFVPYLKFLEYDISSHGNVAAWAERCLSRPAAKRGLGS